MKALKIIVIVAFGYAGMVVAFESMIGVLQPEAKGTLMIITTDENGRPHERVLSAVESGGKLYVAANHWPRAWYEQALQSPELRVRIAGKEQSVVAVPVSGEEHDRLMAEHPRGLVFRIVTGFPPRYFLRLDPR